MKIKIILNDGRVMNAELDANAAPITVANFEKLMDKKFFCGTVFHRVIPGFMIQGGGMNETLEEKKADSIKGEFKNNGVNNTLSHTLGALSMARTNIKDSASSQFFICVKDTPFLDGEYAVFGKLSDEESVKIAIEISQVKTVRVGYYDDVPYSPIVIKSIEKA